MKEAAFRLEVDETGWPPVAVEWLWLERNGENHIVKNAPLFIKGLAVDDEIELCETDSEGEVTKWRLVAPSDRSVVWIADLGGGRLKEILGEFRALGCNTESSGQLAHAAIDVPARVGRANVDSIVDPLDNTKYAIAFPCDRQK